MNKIIVGILIGILFSFTFTFLYRTYWIRDYLAKPFPIEKLDSPKITIQQSVQQIKSLNANFDEKFASINKRLDDFLLFGGMIITLLLAVSVSVYLKTESEVNKHFKEKFGDYSDEAKKSVEDIKRTVSAAKQELSVIQKYRNDITPPTDQTRFQNQPPKA